MSRRTQHERVEVLNGHKFIRLKTGRIVSFLDTLSEADKGERGLARAMSRGLKLAEEYDLDRLEQRIDRLETYVTTWRAQLKKLRNARATRERIAQLRNTAGRTPEEA